MEPFTWPALPLPITCSLSIKRIVGGIGKPLRHEWRCFSLRVTNKPALIRQERPTMLVAPHQWAVGHTFEWEFDLPMPTNPFYQPKTQQKAKKTRKVPTTLSSQRSTTKSPTTQPKHPKASQKQSAPASHQWNAKLATANAPPKTAGNSMPSAFARIAARQQYPPSPLRRLCRETPQPQSDLIVKEKKLPDQRGPMVGLGFSTPLRNTSLRIQGAAQSFGNAMLSSIGL